MRYVILFSVGLALGVLARWAWPEPLSRKPVRVASILRNLQRLQAGGRSAERASSTDSPEDDATWSAPADPRVDAMLRQAGLHPATGDPQLSWLHIWPPGEILLESPDYVKLVKETTSLQLDFELGPLFQELALDPDGTSRLRDILTGMIFDRSQILTMARAMKPPAGADEIADMTNESDGRYRNQIRDALGSEDIARFEAYFAADPARRELSGLFERMAAQDSPLTSDQREALVAVRQAEDHGGPIPALPAMSPTQAIEYAAWVDDERAQSRLREMMGDTYGKVFRNLNRTQIIYQPAARPSTGP